MDSNTIRKFFEFKFDENQSWKEYISEIDSSVPKERIEKLKKIWYRDNIDPRFDPEQADLHTCGGHNNNPNHSHNHSHNQSAPRTNFQQESLIKKGFFDAENVLKLCFIVSSVLRMAYTNTIGYAICFMALYRQLKFPRWNKEYGQKLFINEFAHNVLYLSVLFFFPGYTNIIFYFPLIIHFWIGIAEYLNLRKGFIYEKLYKYVQATRESKEKLMDMKNLVEIYLFPLSIVFIFFGASSIFFIMFYVNYLRIKYILNERMQRQIAYVNVHYIERLKRVLPSPLSTVVVKLQQFAGYLVKMK